MIQLLSDNWLLNLSFYDALEKYTYCLTTPRRNMMIVMNLTNFDEFNELSSYKAEKNMKFAPKKKDLEFSDVEAGISGQEE